MKILILCLLLFQSNVYAFNFRFKFVANKRIVANNGVRRYADGTVAKSCYEYKTKKQGMYDYFGDIGDGIYTISYNGETANVYCDMTTDEGGWTLAFKMGDYDQPGSFSTGSNNLNLLNSPTVIGIGVGTYAKLSDAMINGIKSLSGTQDITYRVTKVGGSFNSTTQSSYWAGACSFGPKTGPSIYSSYPACSKFSNDYANKTLSNGYLAWCNQGNIVGAYFCDGNANARINRVSGYLIHESHNWVHLQLWVR